MDNLDNDCPEIGQKHGRFIVIGFAGLRNKKRFLLVKCSCGTIKEVYKSNLVSGHIVSCGCARKEGIKRYFAKGARKAPVIGV